jgi:hypothetical protein
MNARGTTSPPPLTRARSAARADPGVEQATIAAPAARTRRCLVHLDGQERVCELRVGQKLAIGARARHRRSAARYACAMETEAPQRPSFLRRAVALLVLVAAAALAIHLVIGLVMTIFWVAVALVVAVAVLWALKTVVW